jgi:acyl carrier protein
MDSLGTMQLLVRIEQHFGIQLPAARLTRENASTVEGWASLMIEAGPGNG